MNYGPESVENPWRVNQVCVLQSLRVMVLKYVKNLHGSLHRRRIRQRVTEVNERSALVNSLVAIVSLCPDDVVILTHRSR